MHRIHGDKSDWQDVKAWPEQTYNYWCITPSARRQHPWQPASIFQWAAISTCLSPVCGVSSLCQWSVLLPHDYRCDLSHRLTSLPGDLSTFLGQTIIAWFSNVLKCKCSELCGCEYFCGLLGVGPMVKQRLRINIWLISEYVPFDIDASHLKRKRCWLLNNIEANEDQIILALSCGRWKKMHAQNYSLWKYDEICWNQSYYCWQVCLNARKCLDMFSLASVSLAIQFNKIVVTPCCTDNMSKDFCCVKFSDLSNTWTRLDQMQAKPKEFVFILVWQPSTSSLQTKTIRLDIASGGAFTWTFQALILIIY